MLLRGGRGVKATYPSLLYAAKGRHSISVLSFCLDELCLGCLHPNQIKRVREFVQIVLLFSSSTPNQPSSSLVLLPIRLQAAQPPILSTRHFGIGACPLNFASTVD